MPGLGVRVDGLAAAYGHRQVLGDVSLTVGPGEIVALLGPSGCGKTTLLRCIAGLETPTTGRVTIGGRDVTSGRGAAGVPPWERRVGMVFQDGALFPHRTVGDNVGYGVPRNAQRRQRGLAALRLVGLEDKAERMPGTLSGGEQQRAALARALAPEPSVLLLDEPFASLDAGLRGQLRNDVRQLLKQIAVTTVLVTHDQEEALTFGDRVAVMRAGHITQVGTPAEVYRRPADPWVATFVGEANVIDATFGPRGADTDIGVLPGPTLSGNGSVLCRPEQLTLEPAGPAVVQSAAYFGRDTRYEVRDADGRSWTVRLGGPPAHAAGDRVTLRFTDTSAHGWLDDGGSVLDR